MKLFTDKDVEAHGAVAGAGSLLADREDLKEEPLWHHKAGLQQTQSGYGGKLTSCYKINFNDKLYRVYTTCYSNCASHWFTYKKRIIFIN